MTVATPPPPRPVDAITPGTLEALRGTKPWVRFLGILGFVGSGLMALFAIVMIVLSVLGISAGEGMDGAFLVIMGLVYLAGAVVYVFPSLYLNRYASAIDAALSSPTKGFAVEKAIRIQKSFWKFIGIVMLVSLFLWLPAMLAAIAIPNFLTAANSAKQKRTVEDIRSIASAAEAYATDYNTYPSGESIDALAARLEPTYIQTMPLKDGWGHALHYRATDCNDRYCASYVLASGGKNGELEGPLAPRDAAFVPTTNYNEDMIFSNGRFWQGPEEAARGR